MAVTRDYTLGKGIVRFRPEGTNAWLDLGNAPEFALTLNIDKLEHFSSREGISKKDLEVITQLGVGGSFTLDEPNNQNLSMFVMTDSSDETTRSQSASTGETLTGDGDSAGDITCHALGSWVPLYGTTAGTKTNSAVTDGVNNIGTAVTPVISDVQTADASYMWTIRLSTEGASGAAEVQTRRAGEAWSAGIVVTDATDIDILDGAADSGLDAQFSDIANASLGDEWTFSVAVVNTNSNRVFELDPANPPTITGTGGKSGQTYTEGPDAKGDATVTNAGHYQIDYSAGMIYINTDQSTPSGSDTIVAGEVLACADAEWLAVDSIDVSPGGTLTTLKGDLSFAGNPPQGRKIDVDGFVSLTPSGDFSLIGDDWMQVAFDVEFLEVAGVTGLLRVTDRGKVG